MEDGKLEFFRDTYSCYVDFSDVDDVVIGKLFGKDVLFRDCIKDIHFSEPPQSAADVYDALAGIVVADMDFIRDARRGRTLGVAEFKKFREETGPVREALKLIGDNYLTWD